MWDRSSGVHDFGGLDFYYFYYQWRQPTSMNENAMGFGEDNLTQVAPLIAEDLDLGVTQLEMPTPFGERPVMRSEKYRLTKIYV